MGLVNKLIIKQYQPYIVVLCLFFIFIVFSLTQQTPFEIFRGLISINLTRGVLITDYIEIGGIGAAFMNSVIIGVVTIIFLIRLKITPDGSTIMAMFLTMGFAMFGKDILNMIPITFGTWLYSKAVKRPLSEFYLTGLLAATISPITSEIMFLDIFYLPVNLMMGVLLGTLAGFLFPMISKFLSEVHRGYNLYNMGFVGGFLATFFIAVLTSMGIKVTPALYISNGNNFELGVLLYFIAFFLILCGLIFGDRKKILSDLLSVMNCSGKLASDYYAGYGANIYINMGLLCALGTSVVLIIGAELNGPTIAGIFAMTGFGAFGKHLKNVIPLIVGAIISTHVNEWNPTAPTNVLAILFCTGLAPIAGRYGIIWGLIAGFLHVSVVHHLGYLSSGLNLYSNGFAAGFVALILIPIIEGFAKIFDGKKQRRNS